MKSVDTPAGGSEASLLVLFRNVAGLAGDAAVAVREEPHCPDPGCPLCRTVFLWQDAGGRERRAVVVKPLAYVRRADLERAWRLAAVSPVTGPGWTRGPA